MQRRGRGALALAATALALAVPAAALGGNGNGNGPKADVVHVGDVKVKKPAQAGPARGGARGKCSGSRGCCGREPAGRHEEVLATIDLATGGAPYFERFTLRAVGTRSSSGSRTASTSPPPTAGTTACATPSPRRSRRTSRASSRRTCTRRCRPSSAHRPRRDGNGGLLEQRGPAFPPGYYAGRRRQGRDPDRNFRDQNYYDRHRSSCPTSAATTRATSTRSSSGT